MNQYQNNSETGLFEEKSKTGVFGWSKKR